MNIEQIEQTCAETLLAYAITMAEAYTSHPEDLNASVIALIVRTLEVHTDKPITIQNLHK
jgi:hypothetical protein